MLGAIVSGTSDDMTKTRAAMSLPEVSASTLVVVGDEQRCEQASRMLDTAFLEEPREASVRLIRVTPQRYFIELDTAATNGGSFAVVTDSAFHILSSVVW